MSIHMVEKALWDLLTFREKQALFARAPDEFLDGYVLTDEEKGLLKDWDVRTLTDRGCSPMLTMMSWGAVRGNLAMPEYMRRMNTPGPV